MSWMQHQTDEVIEIGTQLQAEFFDLPLEAMDFKPDRDTWSINECFDHVIQTNRKYYGTLDAIRRGTYRRSRLSRVPILSRLLGRLVVRVVSPDYKGRLKTSPKLFPLQSSYGKNMAVDLADENHVLIAKVRGLDERDLDRVIVTSPVKSVVAYSLRECLRLLVDHEKRHFKQALRVKATLNFEA